jgi:hypothetical protein
MMNNIFQIETTISKGRVESNAKGTRCVVFDDNELVVYRVDPEHFSEIWRMKIDGLAGCAFMGEGMLAISSEASPPMIADVESGKIVHQISEPMKTTLRSRYGRIYSRGKGNAYLRTSYPHLLIEIDSERFLATKAVSAESVSEVVLHPSRDVFGCVVDAISQEIAIGSFEDESFYETSLANLAYVYSIGMSSSGNHLHVVGSDGGETFLQTIDMKTLEIVGARRINLELEDTLDLSGNNRQVFITSKTIPVVGEDFVLLFRSNGEAILTSLSDELAIESPHETTVVSVAQSKEAGTVHSLDWNGRLARWIPTTSNSAVEPSEWKFLRGPRVNGSYETRSKRILY